MSRLTLIGVTGAAVVVVAAGLIYAISQQEGDDSTEAVEAPAPAGAAATSGAASSATTPATSTVASASEAEGVVANSAAQPGAEQAPSFDVVRVNPNGDAVIAGRAKPGSIVTLLDDGKVIGSAKADDRGDWVLLPNSAIAPGEHKFTLQAQEEGGPALASERMVIVVVPAPAKDIAGNAVAAPAGALALSVPQNGDGPSEILNMPSTGGIAAAPTGPTDEPTLDIIDFDQDGRMSLAGRAKAGTKVLLYLDDKLIGTSGVDAQGRWHFMPDDRLEVGRHELRIDQVNAEGKVMARIVQPVEQPDFAALIPGGSQIVVQPGNSLWRLARRTYGEGLRFSVIYEANRDRIRDPDLIYPGQVLTLPQ
jgi:nucleoid-associated protein YgaU